VPPASAAAKSDPISQSFISFVGGSGLGVAFEVKNMSMSLFGIGEDLLVVVEEEKVCACGGAGKASKWVGLVDPNMSGLAELAGAGVDFISGFCFDPIPAKESNGSFFWPIIGTDPNDPVADLIG
jgi:hypothetical protein